MTLPSTTMTAPRVGSGTKVIHRYCHDPYGARVLEPLPAVITAAAVAAAAIVAVPAASPTLTPAALTPVERAAACMSTAAAADSQDGMECPTRDTLPTVRQKGVVVYTGTVAFKYGTKKFSTIARVEIGDAIIVDGDRGEDLGFVRRVAACSINSNHNNNSIPYVDGRVRRLATAEDLQEHHARAQKEEEALCTMRVLAKQLKCRAFIQDVMYQLDGRKITVIISRESRAYVDFRRLQRAAFDVFRCRVWCEYLDEISAPRSGGACNSSTFAAARGLPRRPKHRRLSRCLVSTSDTSDVVDSAPTDSCSSSSSLYGCRNGYTWGQTHTRRSTYAFAGLEGTKEGGREQKDGII